MLHCSSNLAIAILPDWKREGKLYHDGRVVIFDLLVAQVSNLRDNIKVVRKMRDFFRNKSITLSFWAIFLSLILTSTAFTADKEEKKMLEEDIIKTSAGEVKNPS